MLLLFLSRIDSQEGRKGSKFKGLYKTLYLHSSCWQMGCKYVLSLTKLLLPWYSTSGYFHKSLKSFYFFTWQQPVPLLLAPWPQIKCYQKRIFSVKFSTFNLPKSLFYMLLFIYIAECLEGAFKALMYHITKTLNSVFCNILKDLFGYSTNLPM